MNSFVDLLVKGVVQFDRFQLAQSSLTKNKTSSEAALNTNRYTPDNDRASVKPPRQAVVPYSLQTHADRCTVKRLADILSGLTYLSVAAGCQIAQAILYAPNGLMTE